MGLSRFQEVWGGLWLAPVLTPVPRLPSSRLLLKNTVVIRLLPMLPLYYLLCLLESQAVFPVVLLRLSILCGRQNYPAATPTCCTYLHAHPLRIQNLCTTASYTPPPLCHPPGLDPYLDIVSHLNLYLSSLAPLRDSCSPGSFLWLSTPPFINKRLNSSSFVLASALGS